MSFVRIFKVEKTTGHVVGVLRAAGQGFVTTPVDDLHLGFDGIADDLHHGGTRRAGAREPWYRRGTEIRNDRQVTIVSPADLKLTAAGMEIDELRAEWIGANLILEGVPRLSMLHAGTLMMFAGGAALRIVGQNAPCRFAGAEIARHHPGRGDLDTLFPKVAKRLRGLIAWVEKPGVIRPGERADLRLPEQWIYQSEEMAESEQESLADLL